MVNKSPKLTSATMFQPQIVTLAWEDGRICNLDLSDSLPQSASNPHIEDWGYSLEFEGSSIDFSSSELYKRAAWQDRLSPDPETLKAWRKRHHLTQEQLADLFDVSRRTIQYYETGTLLIPRLMALAMKGYEAERDGQAA